MLDEIRLRLMRKKPTLDDLVQPNMTEDAKIAFRVVLRRAKREQQQLLKKAAKIKD